MRRRRARKASASRPRPPAAPAHPHALAPAPGGRRLAASLAALACLAPHASAGAAAAATHHYRVGVDAELSRLDVRACLARRALPTELRAGSREAARFLRTDALPEGARLTGGDGRRLVLDAAALDAAPSGTASGAADAPDPDALCLDYSVDLAAAVAADGWRTASRYGDDVVMRSTLWLWRPPAPADDEDLVVRFELPAGFDVSVPWQPAGRAGEHRFRVGATPYAWPARTAIGRFRVREVALPGGGHLRLAALHGTPEDAMARWLGEAAGAVATLYGQFPLAAPQVLVVPIGRQSQAVPWAQVVRGGGAAALFFVDPARPLDEFRADWTATHEFSHLLLPYLDRDDAWLSEGLASYYQNVLRARAGMLGERGAWERMEAGFGRGRAQSRAGTLDWLSREMASQRAHRRVYWSGAAYWLEADVSLRRHGDGSQSLDTALAALHACCLPAERMWSGRELTARLDALTGTRLFSTLAARYEASRDFPDVSGIYALLGVQVQGSRVQLDDAATLADVRRAIMRAAVDPRLNTASAR